MELRGRQQSKERGLEVSRVSDVVFCSVSDGSALLNLSRGVYFGLDPVGTRIWELLLTPKSPADLVDVLMKEYDVGADHCRASVTGFLEQLSTQGLINYEAAVARD